MMGSEKLEKTWGRNGSRICCSSCGQVIKVTMEKKVDGDIESIFFSCPECGAKYLVSVTDTSLRNRVQEYVQPAIRNRQRRLPVEQQILMQELKALNMKRGRELQRMYPMGEKQLLEGERHPPEGAFDGRG